MQGKSCGRFCEEWMAAVGLDVGGEPDDGIITIGFNFGACDRIEEDKAVRPCLFLSDAWLTYRGNGLVYILPEGLSC